MKLDKTLVRDAQCTPIQGFSPDPAKCAAGVTINPGGTHTVNVATEKLMAILFQVNADIRVHLNGDTSKTMTFGAWQPYTILINHMITSVNFYNAGSTAVVLQRWGM